MKKIMCIDRAGTASSLPASKNLYACFYICYYNITKCQKCICPFGKGKYNTNKFVLRSLKYYNKLS